MSNPPQRCLCLDIETSHSAETALRKIGAWRSDDGRSVYLQAPLPAERTAAALDPLAHDPECLLGHNIAQHDLPILARLYPGLALHRLPCIDTLQLSPLAFPENPYHHLVKDYKLIRDSKSDPIQDARRAYRLFADEWQAFRELHAQRPPQTACYHHLLAEFGGGYDRLFAELRSADAPGLDPARDCYAALVRDRVCNTRLRRLLAEDFPQPALRLPLAYTLAWLRVSGGNSVLPPWVLHQYPATRALIAELRDTACAAPDCGYCRQYHDPRRELARHFGFAEFRPNPANAEGGSLQEDIVRAGLARENLLAILPTGAGKSLCYQLPALSRYWRDGSLTVIVSPLQSLMKDQVDGLIRQGVFCGAALNGLLSMPERREVLDQVRRGDVGILLVSPEQFRNRGFAEAIKHRQIGAWIFDEAHCLSKWGHDFRTDYLYVSRFIRERHGAELPPIGCFTATAKPDVIEDLAAHFRAELGITLRLLASGHERPNLHFEVAPVRKAEKCSLIHTLLERELKPTEGGAVVFAARRKSAEDIAAYLKQCGWACAHFHAGIEPGLKKEIQQSFLDGDLRVIVATNAFGMGVDKADVRAVIHAEIPGSLENYLQEAGRAGRDRRDSRCILLYDEDDVETQFSLAARSRLSRKDIAEILRVLRRRAARVKDRDGLIVITAGELLAEEELDTSIAAENPDAETKVKTAVAWLERNRFLQRDENHTRVFPGSLRLSSLEAVEKRLLRQNLSEDMRRKYLDVAGALFNAEADEGISTDALMLATGLASTECIRVLQGLEQCGVLSNDIGMSFLLRKGVRDASTDRLRRVAELERALLELLPELAPDADREEWQEMHPRALCQELRRRTGRDDLLPEHLLALLRTMHHPFGESQAQRAMFDLRAQGRERLAIRLRRAWHNIRQIAERRRAVAQVLLTYLLNLLPAGVQGVDLRVECRMGDLARALGSDVELAASLNDPPKALQQGLLYLHETQVLIVDRGKSVFRSAMTIRLYPEESKRRFGQSDYQPLREYYREKNFQVHVMQEYARLGLAKLSEALAFVAAYFRWPKSRFIREYFANRRDLLDLATTEESYRRIVADLRHPLQERLVSEKPELNRLVLAGPGSGKTRLIVHRVAYLLRVLREAADGILVLSFNRAAASEIRRRLHGLVGDGAYGVTVLTYHALALRLTGTSLAGAAETDAAIDFEALLERAIELLEGGTEAGVEADELRERLLRGYRFVLVDEYQDIDERQYRLIGALTGRTRQDRDARLTILAVGDDDQNIYAFRHASIEFIRRFEADYEARTEFLVENYRSSAHIVAAANAVIQGNAGRLKGDAPIRVNFSRRDDPPGGRWTRLDPMAQGRVQVLATPEDGNRQAQLALREIERLKALDPAADWSDFAVLARTHHMLQAARAWCEWRGVPYLLAEHGSNGAPELHKTREGLTLIRWLRRRPGRCLRHGVLRRWAARRRDPMNPWSELLLQCVAELEDAWNSAPIPRGQALEWLYEYGAETRTPRGGHLNLSTVHAVKGREFRHVLLLDGGDWGKGKREEECRLYYVGMTRAMETLTLCEGLRQTNPFTRALAAGEFLSRTEPAEWPPALPPLDVRYKRLGLADVDLGFAGRKSACDPVHQAIADLRVGDALSYVDTGQARELRDRRGVAVGRLSRQCGMPAGEILSVTVSAIVGRSRRQCRGTPHEERCRVEEWEVVLCHVAVDGGESSGDG